MTIFWSSDIFTDFECPGLIFSEFVKIEGAQKENEL